MTVRQHAVRYGHRRLGSRLGRLAPWIGTAIALAAFAATVRRKGLVRGAADTALNATPIVGGLKAIAEIARGRDFIPDRRVRG